MPRTPSWPGVRRARFAPAHCELACAGRRARGAWRVRREPGRARARARLAAEPAARTRTAGSARRRARYRRRRRRRARARRRPPIVAVDPAGRRRRKPARNAECRAVAAAMPALLEAAARRFRYARKRRCVAATSSRWRLAARSRAARGVSPIATAKPVGRCIACRAAALAPRTAGDALRVGVLVRRATKTEAAAFAPARGDEAMRRRSSRWWNIRRAPTFPVNRNAVRAADDGRTLPHLGDVAARPWTRHDLDLLIDLAGVRVAAGPLLALHPARALWCIESRHSVVTRLADRVFHDARRRCRGLCGACVRLQFADCGTAEVYLDSRGALDPMGGGGGRPPAWRPRLRARGLQSVLTLSRVCARAVSRRSCSRNAGDMVRGPAHAFGAAVDAAPATSMPVSRSSTALVDCRRRQRRRPIAREGLMLDAGQRPLWRALGQAELARERRGGGVAAFDRPRSAPRRRGHAIQPWCCAADGRATRRCRTCLPARAGVPARSSCGRLQSRGHLRSAGQRRRRRRRVLERPRTRSRSCRGLQGAGGDAPRFRSHRRLVRELRALRAASSRRPRARRACTRDLRIPGRLRPARPLPRRPARRPLHRPDDANETLDALQQLLYLLHFFDVEPELIGRYARTHDALATRLYGPPRPRRTERRPGKIRIGYLSGDFRNHVMGKMMLEPLRHHDRERFDVFGYATNDARDDWTPRFEAVFARFATLGTLSDQAAAERIAEDDLDVLVDLSTHTKGARPGILARKPARVQVTHVASAGTLAMSAIDFKLTDRYADTGDTTPAAIEPLLVMEGCVYPYRHIAPAGRDAAFARVARHGERCRRHRRVLHAAQAFAALSCPVARGARARSRMPCSRFRRFIPRSATYSSASPMSPASMLGAWCSCRRAATTPRTRRAIASSISCSIPCPTAASTARSRRSTWACPS